MHTLADFLWTVLMFPLLFIASAVITGLVVALVLVWSYRD